jgi:Uma2 family endonuclease
MAAPVYWTADMVRALPDDGNRYEVVWGELLVTPAPRPWHQIVLARLQLAFGKHLDGHPTAFLLASPADISWGPDILVQPDLFVVPLEEVRTLEWDRIKGLLLAIEVLSPSTARYDRFTKRRLYQQVGIPRYWIVGAQERVVEVWTPEATTPVIERDRLAWTPPGDTTALAIDLAELFRPV